MSIFLCIYGYESIDVFVYIFEYMYAIYEYYIYALKTERIISINNDSVIGKTILMLIMINIYIYVYMHSYMYIHSTMYYYIYKCICIYKINLYIYIYKCLCIQYT
jgi:hypothetical protein